MADPAAVGIGKQVGKLRASAYVVEVGDEVELVGVVGVEHAPRTERLEVGIQDGFAQAVRPAGLGLEFGFLTQLVQEGMGKSEDVRILVAGYDLLQKAAHLGAVQGVLITELHQRVEAYARVFGAQGEVEGLEGFARLSELTGTEIPAPLAALAGKRVRFEGCVAKERMPEQVMGMLW